MTESEFRTLDPLADALDEACARWFASPELAALKDALRKAVASLPPTYSVSIDVELRVFDNEREQALNLLTTGLNTDHEGEPYRISGDSSVHRYVAGGEICEVPHDRCPQCWGSWDYKHKRPSCPQCGVQMGSDVRLLLDSDVCPYCDRGRITSDNLTCGECGFTIDPRYVTWG
jgi:Zn-finger nucleic acid-binding protein